jgi:hypothetical protein
MIPSTGTKGGIDMETKTAEKPWTLPLANFCHQCPVCDRAERRPRSLFGRFMRWHRMWCPAWKAHIEIYGPKSFAA